MVLKLVINYEKNRKTKYFKLFDSVLICIS